MKNRHKIIDEVKAVLKNWFPNEQNGVLEMISIKIWDIVHEQKQKSWWNGFVFGIVSQMITIVILAMIYGHTK